MQKTPYSYTSRTIKSILTLSASIPFTLSSYSIAGGYSQVSGLAQREIIRRQEAVSEADRLFLDGRTAYSAKDYQKAVDHFRSALSSLPETVAFADRKASYKEHLSDASVALAQEFRKSGKLEEARVLLDSVSDANSEFVSKESSYLKDPIRTNPALTAEHSKNVDEVSRMLYMAEGNYDLGKFDAAKTNYESVLRIDPHNTAARRGMEKIAATKSDYYRAAYDHTRSELLMQVDQAWELSVPAELPEFENSNTTEAGGGDGVAYISEKLRRINIPSVNFEEGTSLEDAIDFLRMRAVELDTLELDPDRKGLNIVIQRPRVGTNTAPAIEGGEQPLLGADDLGSLSLKNALRLRNVPLATALDYLCQMTRLRYKVGDFAVTLVPQTETGEDLFSRTFRVPPDFVASLNSGGQGGEEPEADPFASGDAPSSSTLKPRPPVIELLRQAGITFGEGSSATLSSSGALVITNTPSELDKIDQLIEATSDTPKQVKITTKFVEISHENTDELGFDWVLQADTGLDNFIQGGSVGSGGARKLADFGTDLITGASGDSVSNMVTNGLRSGDQAFARNNIDGLINNPNRTAQNNTVAPGILGFKATGIFDDSEVSMVMRGLAQKKGADLMTAPSVTARSGQKATIEVIREFIYPTEYEPPELPQQVGSTSTTSLTTNTSTSSSSGVFPVTPATPTAFETRNTGVTLQIEPTIGENDFVIDVRFLPEIVEFEGFVNYGSPIQSSAVVGNSVQPITITENRIEMPVFSKRSVETSLTIYDGYTVAVGGLMREDVQTVEDKVPIFGDLPIIGRLFQSKGENRIKSNLILFVKAEIIDATGRLIRGTDTLSSLPGNSPLSGAADGVLPVSQDLPD